MTIIKCFRSCNCTLKVLKHTENNMSDMENVNEKICAGVCVIVKNKILINQSYNLFWGIPKGIVENNETLLDCALRELKEETSIKIDRTNIAKYVFSFKYKKMNRKVCIFFSIINNNESNLINESELDKDSTGYGFIKPLCLLELFYSRKIQINYFTRVLLNNLFF